MRYFVGLGSNIAPRTNLPLMLRALLRIAPTVHVGRVIQTDPVGVAGEPFLNVPAAFCTGLGPQDLKALLNGVEASLGRDRADPESKVKSRTADLDILLWMEEGAAAAPAEQLPPEPYMRPMLIELLAALGMAAGAERTPLPPGVPLSIDGLSFGVAPLTLRAAGGRLSSATLELSPAGPA